MRRYKEWTAYMKLKKGGLFLIGMSMAAVLAACGNQTVDSDNKARKSQELVEENPDSFAWLIVPDTNIDYPIAQNIDGDDTFYQTHDITVNLDIFIAANNIILICSASSICCISTTEHHPIANLSQNN